MITGVCGTMREWHQRDRLSLLAFTNRSVRNKVRMCGHHRVEKGHHFGVIRKAFVLLKCRRGDGQLGIRKELLRHFFDLRHRLANRAVGAKDQYDVA